jgi:CBS domain containing-hemolysin-like protein
MTGVQLAVVAQGGAVVAALWAGLLALVQESPTVGASLSEPPTRAGEPVPVDRAMQMSRLALVVVAGCSAGLAVGWWVRTPLNAVVQGVVTVVFLLTLSDLAPRALGVLFPHVATAAVPLARRSLLPFRPLIGLVAAAERVVSSLLPPEATEPTALQSEVRDVLAGVVSLHDTTVAEVMTPRLDVEAVEAGAEWPELVEQLRRSEHHRLPVYGDDLDDLRGVLYAKDLTPAIAGVAERPTDWRSLVRPAQYVPESKLLANQLRDFQRSTAHLAIVVDEFGGTSGLITLEDVLEEVVGEIYGEYDREEVPDVVREGDDRFWVDGAVTLDTLLELLGVALEEDEVSTVGGLIYAELGRVPRPGEELYIAGFRVVVEKVVRRRIQRVYFERAVAKAGGTP